MDLPVLAAIGRPVLHGTVAVMGRPVPCQASLFITIHTTIPVVIL